MKLKFKDKLKKNKFIYKEELKEELKNNSIVLSFAVSIIVVGIISIFYKNSNSLLIGIAVSSLLLTIIQCFSNGNTMLNILPIFTLLIFGFFQKSIEHIPIINILLKEQYANFIIFLAFSLTFLTQAYKNIIFKYSLKKATVNFNKDKNKMIQTELEIIKNIKDKSKRIRRSIDDANIKNDNIRKSIKDLIDYVDEEKFISNVKSTLITKGSEDMKVTFNIEEVEESIMLNSQINRNRDINAVKKEEE